MTPTPYTLTKSHLGLTHAALAELLGIHPTTAREYTSRAPPESIRRLLACIEAMGVERYRETIAHVSLQEPA